MSKFLKIEISRSEYTELYVEVPDDFSINDARKLPLQKFTKNQVHSFDWETQDELEFCGARFIQEAEARAFTMDKVDEQET